MCQPREFEPDILETDVELLRRSKKGDQCAFEELVRRYWQKIFGFLCHGLESPQDAEDLVSETFLDAFKSRFKISDKPEAFKRWLYKVAAVKKKAYWKDKYRKPRYLPLDSVPPVCQYLDIPGTVAVIEAVLESLSEKQKNILVAYYFEDSKLKGVSQATGTSVSTACRLVKEAKERLNEVLDS